jgi:ketosteroid isomerase-like protein
VAIAGPHPPSKGADPLRVTFVGDDATRARRVIVQVGAVAFDQRSLEAQDLADQGPGVVAVVDDDRVDARVDGFDLEMGLLAVPCG